jgi:phytoene dehydrogenase-like protein
VTELVDESNWRPETVAAARDAVMTLGLVVLYVVVDIDLTDRPNTNYHVFPDWETEAIWQTLEEGELPADETWTYVSMASRKDPDNAELCPPGHTNFQIMTLAPRGYSFWGIEEGPAHGARYRRDERYREAKDDLTDRLIRSAERALGPFRDHIVHMEMATPLTHERYTLSSEGTSYGLQHSPEQSGRHRPGFKTEIPGLYVTGANTVAGHGIAGTIVGGAMCASDIADRPMFIEAMMGSTFVDPGVLPSDAPDWDPVDVSRGAALRATRAEGREARATT